MILAQATTSGLMGVAVAALALVTLANGIVSLWSALGVSRLKAKIEEQAEKIIAEKFKGFQATCELEHKTISLTIGAMQKRLDRGDGAFDNMGERGHAIESKLMNKLDTLKDWIRDNCASKSEVEKLGQRFDAIAGK